MKSVENTLLLRRSIRRYTTDPIKEKHLNYIYKCISNTPTSYNGQQYTVIAIDDSGIKERLFELTNQKQVKTCALLLVFCVDYHKIKLYAEMNNLEYPPYSETLDSIIVGVIDASLAMNNALIAAESCGLGTCCIGYLRTANIENVNELLNIPNDVFIVCGLSIGVPRETPDIKPKQLGNLLIHKNIYDDEYMKENLMLYDETIKEFNNIREGEKSENDWGSHIINYYKDASDINMLNYLSNHGFKIKR